MVGIDKLRLSGDETMTKEEEQVAKTSINIKEQLLEDFKIYCIKNKVSMTDKIDELIRKEIKK